MGNYTLLFKSLTGTDYRLVINGTQNSGSLTGGAATFETLEDADTDMFTPIRTQTGSLRFEGNNDHDTWLDILPQNALDRRVVLYTGSTIKWQGFVQPQVFENEFPGIGPVSHELPVQCPLSVLDTVDVATDGQAIVTFGQLLQNYIFKVLTDAGVTISLYYIQGNSTVTSARLDLKVLWANFLDTDSTGNIKPKYTYKQLLEEFCKFFGYTCRMHGDAVYFTMPVDNSQGFTLYTSTGLYDATTHKASYSAAIVRGSFGITDAMMCTNDNSEQLNPGIGKVTVKSDINKLDNLIEIPYDELYDQYNTGLPASPIISRGINYISAYVYNLIRYPDTNNAYLNYENDSVALQLYMATVPNANGIDEETKKYCRFFVYDDGDVGSLDDQNIPESKESFGWRKCVELFHGFDYAGGNTTTMFTIASKQEFVISDGYLYINFKCDQIKAAFVERWSHTPLSPYAVCRMKIGEKYWNGSAWTTTSATFNLEFDASGARTTRTSITDPQYNGYGIPVGDTLRGIMEFSILDVPQYVFSEFAVEIPINGFLPMHDFEIGFVRNAIEEQKHHGNEYVKTGGAFRDEYNVDLIFASDVPYGNNNNFTRRMPAGLGYILNYNNERPTQNIPSMSGSYVVAEEELARVISVFGSQTHRVVQLKLRSNLLGNVTPSKMSTVNTTTDPGMAAVAGMFPLAISYDWRDDITTLTLIKI